MTNTHDSVRHLEYLRHSLSQDKKPIGFFLSAGCPLAVQMEEDEWPLIPDVQALSEWIREKLKENAKFTLLIEELEKANRDINNVEDILSFIRGLLLVATGGEVRGLKEAELLDLERQVCEKIVEKINVELPKDQTPYHQLVKWIKSIDREIPIQVFTTNYDLLMEQALEDLEVPYFDGFVGSRKSFFDLRAVEDNLIPEHWTRLWKIHGSINWYQEKVDDQTKVYRSSEIKKDASHLIYPSHLKYEESRKMPYLALIDQLSRFIRLKSSFLIISGYSFNDGHLNDTIINALKANPTAMVLGLMYDFYYENGEETERYSKAYKLSEHQHNLNIWTFDRAVIGTNIGKWTKNKETEDQDILQFIENNDNQNTPSKIIKMGDFSVFTNFLKTLIGSEKEFQDDK